MSGVMVPNQGVYAEVTAQVSQLPSADREREIDDYITWVEDRLLGLAQQPFEMGHQFIDGLYIRTMRVPEGTTLTGAIHKRGCLTILWEGKLSVLTSQGSALLEAPLIFPAAAGVRRLGYCHSEVLMSTIHSVSSTNLDEVEEELFDFVGPEV